MPGIFVLVKNDSGDDWVIHVTKATHQIQARWDAYIEVYGDESPQAQTIDDYTRVVKIIEIDGTV